MTTKQTYPQQTHVAHNPRLLALIPLGIRATRVHKPHWLATPLHSGQCLKSSDGVVVAYPTDVIPLQGLGLRRRHGHEPASSARTSLFLKEWKPYQIIASAVWNSVFISSVYLEKSSHTRALNLELGSGAGVERRPRATMDVIDGWWMAWRRTSVPTKPVAPVTMIFMVHFAGCVGGRVCWVGRSLG